MLAGVSDFQKKRIPPQQVLPVAYLIPGCLEKRVELGSQSSSGSGAAADVWKSENLEDWKSRNLGIRKSGSIKSENLEIGKCGTPTSETQNISKWNFIMPNILAGF